MVLNKKIAKVLFLSSFLLVLNLFFFPVLAQEPSLSGKYHFQSGHYGGSLVLSTTTDPKSFNPIVAKEVSTTAITGYLFEGLTTTNGVTLKVEPNLAKRWTVDESGKVWTFYLREDVNWFDGEQFTASDVIFTFDKLVYNSQIPTASRDIFTVEGKEFKVEKIDEFTVRFTLPVVFAPFLRSMSHEILPQHILEKPVRKGEFSSYWGLGTDPNKIIGTGPFKLESYSPGERLVLVRNKDYWKKDSQGNSLPYLDKVVYRIVQNQDVALLKFLEGELDYYSLRGQDYPVLKPKEKTADFKVYNAGPSFGSNFLVFNQNRGKNPRTGSRYVAPYKLNWFTDVKFRQAVAYAVDRDSIISIIMNGLGAPQYSSMSPSAGFFYNPDVKKYPYDLEKAKSILKSIGIYDRDGNRIAEDEEGNELVFNLFTNADNTTRLAIGNIIRKDFKRIGFKVNFVPLEFNQIVAKLDSTFDWDVILLGLTGGIEPHFGNNVWQSSGHLHMWYPRQEEPVTPWEARIDKIFDKAVQTLDKEKRKRLYDEWQEIVSEKVPFVYTVLGFNIFAVKQKFGNLAPTAYGGAFHNLEEIYVLDREDAHR